MNIQPGMALGVQRPGYKHYGIYAGIFHEAQFVIHYNDKCSGGRGRIEPVLFHNFLKGDEWWIVDVNGMEYTATVLENSLARAASRFHEQKYNIITNNCEHFATWCVTGKAQSRQVEEIVAGLLLDPRQTVLAKIEECIVTMLGKAFKQHPLITVGVVVMLGTMLVMNAVESKGQQKRCC